MRNEVVTQILKSARELIAKPEGWTQGVSARDADGLTVSGLSTKAVCFCSIGALNRVLYDMKKDNTSEDDLAWKILGRVFHERMGMSIVNVNDNSKHSTVLALWDEAIRDSE